MKRASNVAALLRRQKAKTSAAAQDSDGETARAKTHTPTAVLATGENESSTSIRRTDIAQHRAVQNDNGERAFVRSNDTEDGEGVSSQRRDEMSNSAYSLHTTETSLRDPGTSHGNGRAIVGRETATQIIPSVQTGQGLFHSQVVVRENRAALRNVISSEQNKLETRLIQTMDSFQEKMESLMGQMMLAVEDMKGNLRFNCYSGNCTQAKCKDDTKSRRSPTYAPCTPRDVKKLVETKYPGIEQELLLMFNNNFVIPALGMSFIEYVDNSVLPSFPHTYSTVFTYAIIPRRFQNHHC